MSDCEFNLDDLDLTPEQFEYLNAKFSDPVVRILVWMQELLFRATESGINIKDDSNKIVVRAINLLTYAGLFECEISGKIPVLNVESTACVEFSIAYSGNIQKTFPLVTDIGNEFKRRIRTRKLVPDGEDIRLVTNDFKISKIRLTPEGYHAKNTAVFAFNNSLDEQGEPNGPLVVAETMAEYYSIGQDVEQGQHPDPCATPAKVIDGPHFHFGLDTVPLLEPPKKTARKKTAAKKKVPLADLLATLPPFPTDERENNDWTTANKIGIESHRQRRDEGEKKVLDNGTVFGRDKQGRICWKPEEDSKKVFYLKSSLPPARHKKASKRRKK